MYFMSHTKNLKILFSLFIILSSCSINKMAVRAVSDSFSEGGEEIFSRDDDPELVKDALPLLLKVNEILIEKDPDNFVLKASAGKLFIIYSNLFIHTPADMLDYTDWKKQSEMYLRAKKMYLRGSNYLKEALETEHDITIDLSDRKTIDCDFKKDDADILYWLGGGLMSAVSIDITDPVMASVRNTAMQLMFDAYELDPDYGKGALHEYFLRYYASLPPGMGGSDEKAEYHYSKAVELSDGSRISPFISYAVSLSIKKQTSEGLAEFKNMLENALNMNIDDYPDNRLENIIMKQKAQWLLDNVDNYFLID